MALASEGSLESKRVLNDNIKSVFRNNTIQHKQEIKEIIEEIYDALQLITKKTIEKYIIEKQDESEEEISKQNVMINLIKDNEMIICTLLKNSNNLDEGEKILEFQKRFEDFIKMKILPNMDKLDGTLTPQLDSALAPQYLMILGWRIFVISFTAPTLSPLENINPLNIVLTEKEIEE